jgi:hypothetical protein
VQGAADPQVLSLVDLYYALPADLTDFLPWWNAYQVGHYTLEEPLGAGAWGICARTSHNFVAYP